MKLIKISEGVYVNLNAIESVQEEESDSKSEYFIATICGQCYTITEQLYRQLINSCEICI